MEQNATSTFDSPEDRERCIARLRESKRKHEEAEKAKAEEVHHEHLNE